MDGSEWSMVVSEWSVRIIGSVVVSEWSVSGQWLMIMGWPEHGQRVDSGGQWVFRKWSMDGSEWSVVVSEWSVRTSGWSVHHYCIVSNFTVVVRNWSL